MNQKKCTLSISLLLCFMFSAALAQENYMLPLADSLNKWSDGQVREAFSGGPKVEIHSRVIKYFGTTGIIEVSITNRTNGDIGGTCGLKVTNDDIGDNSVHENNVYSFSNLKPDYYVTFKMELRACLPKNRRGMDDLQKIAACQPRLLFPTKTVVYK